MNSIGCQSKSKVPIGYWQKHGIFRFAGYLNFSVRTKENRADFFFKVNIFVLDTQQRQRTTQTL